MPEQPNKPVKAAQGRESAKDSFTIVDKKTRAVFIQQPLASKEEAAARLSELRAKFGTQYDLVIARVDEQGNLHAVSKDE